MIYKKEFVESEELITLVYDSSPDADIESILESVIAYKRLLQKSVFILTGEDIDLRKPLDEITLTLAKHTKGSEIFDFVCKIVPKPYQKPVLIGVGVVVLAGTLLTTANLYLDFQLKLRTLNENTATEQRLTKVEELLKEQETKITELLRAQHNGNTTLSCRTPALRALDWTEEDFNLFVKPIKDKTARSVKLFQNKKLKYEFNEENTNTVDLSLLNEKQTISKKKVKFEQVNTRNKKEWKIITEDGSTIKAIIKDVHFFSLINKIEFNILKPSFEVEMTEYWKRQKGESELTLTHVEVTKVNFEDLLTA